MDNVTHTLVSAMVGAAVAAFTPAPPGARAVAVGVLAVGGNLPDADVVYTTLAGTRLDYLLQHRGYTHTLVGALVLAVPLAAGFWLWWRRREPGPSPGEVRLLVALAVLAPLLHLGLDATNSYGVHPFWPVDDRWYYGDAVFIVEPLLWAGAAPLLVALRSRVLRALVGVALAVGIGLGWASGLVPVSSAVLLTLLTVGLVVVGRRARVRTALASGVAAWLAVTALFVVTGRAADARVAALLAREFPAERVLDTVLTPLPANPVCREVLTASTVGDRYVVRSATHSQLPGWLTAGQCARYRLAGTPTAPLAATPAPSTDETVWDGELAMPLDLPATLARRYCAAGALLQFARVPWAAPRGDGWVVGDLRYDREPELGFAEVEVGPSTDACPAARPPWVPPRADLLTGP